jgi:hypothetical protein
MFGRLRRGVAASLPVLLLAAVVLCTPGCDDAPLDLNEGAGGDGGGGGAGGDGAGSPAADPGGPSGGGGPALGGGPPEVIPDDVMIVPDVAAFQADILPRLDSKCGGLTCHTGRPGPAPGDLFFRFFGFPDYRVDQLEPGEVQASLEDTVDHVLWLQPEQSALLQKGANLVPHDAPTPSINEGDEDWNAIVAWMEASIVYPEPDPEPDAGMMPDPGMMPGPGGTTIPCEVVPDPRQIRPEYDFDWFQAQVNPTLIARCASGAGCHADQSMEHALWYQTGADECATRWNMLATLWFVDTPADVVSSELLEQPLRPRHGGSVVFEGRDDCDYILLKLWLEGATCESLRQARPECAWVDVRCPP